MNDASDPLVVFIATPLAIEYVDRIRRVAPERVGVIYEPDLLPPIRYDCDHNGEAGFSLTPEQTTRWRAHLARAHVVWDFPPNDPDGTSWMSLAPKLEWIQTTSSGVGQKVRALGLDQTNLMLTTARGIHAGPLTEFVFLALLSHVKQLSHLRSEQQAHRWERFCGDELDGKTLGIVGAGGIGRTVASVGRAFGMRIVAVSRPGATTTADQIGVDVLFPAAGLHSMLAETDALVLSVPLTAETELLIDRAALNALKSEALFVNISRGRVVDEQALIECLVDGKIAFAALDVFAIEPLPAESPLWDLPNVLISPHSASTARRENERITDIFCHNLRCYLDGRREAMKNVFNKELLY